MKFPLQLQWENRRKHKSSCRTSAADCGSSLFLRWLLKLLALFDFTFKRGNSDKTSVKKLIKLRPKRRSKSLCSSPTEVHGRASCETQRFSSSDAVNKSQDKSSTSHTWEHVMPPNFPPVARRLLRWRRGGWKKKIFQSRSQKKRKKSRRRLVSEKGINHFSVWMEECLSN